MLRESGITVMYRGGVSGGGLRMRTTINLDVELLAEAQRVTGCEERTLLIHEGLRALIQRENARRLARLGGSERALRSIPRRRSRPS